MQARTCGGIRLGFAAGMAVLAIVLWSTGHLTGYRQEVAMAATALPRAPDPCFQPPSLAAPCTDASPGPV